MADISKIKLPDETEVNLKDAQAFANIENDGQGGSSYTITRRDGTTKQVTIPNVTTTDPGLMTASDKTKIDTIEQGAEVNQQAFSKIRITKGSAHTDLDADTKTDTLELIEGDNITLTPSAVSDAVTIHAKDTVYTLAQDTTDGHIIILTNNDEGSTDHVQTITIPDNNTTYTVSLDSITNEIILTDSFGNTTKAKPNNASASLDGFMSKSDKSKLDGIASGAEVNQNAFSNVIVDNTTISADSKTDTLTFIAGSNITITPNATNDSITIASSYTNTTYELSQDATDGHKFTLTGSNGYTKTITIPDNNTTYTLSIGTGTDADQIIFTPSSGSATKITVPYATKALKDADGSVIKDTYAASFSISDHTITLKNKSGVSLGTVTVPDNNTTYTFAEGTTNKAFSVTPSGGSAQTVPIHGLGSASEKNFTTSVTSGSADLVTSGAVASAISTAIDNLPEPMIFKGTLGTNGTITSLPTASSSNEGWTYKVITAGTYASQAAKVGDMFVSAKIGSAYQWVYVPSGDDVEDTWRNIKVNGTEKLGTGISSGAVDFVDGDFINITYANNKITVSHADTSSQASVSNSGRTYIQSVTLDGAGHVTKLTSATETVVNTDRYVNSASFADDTTASANSPVKMTLTRAGSDTATVTANIPKVSASSAGVAPKGATVSSQSQSTKFLREDGTWSAPSYTVNTDTKVTSVGNHYSPTADSSAQLSASASGGTAAWSIDVVQGVQLQRDAKGHVVGVTVTSGKIPGNPNTNYYHKTGSWNGLTYTAGKVGSPDDLVFTIPTGTSATTVALGNHTHSTTIATSTGTNQLTLAHGGKYVITAGGTSFIFTMPTDNNTDTNVTQTATNTNANYEVLFSGTADNTTRTEGARKYSNLTFNPSTGTLTTTKIVSANATLGVADIDTANITEDNVGNLIVTGAARFLNTINGSISGNAATATNVAWTGVTGKPSEFTPSSGSGYYLTREVWWNSSDTSKNPDDLLSGITFAYNNKHGNVPTTGTIVAFAARPNNQQYPLQLQGSYNSTKLYFRNRNGDNSTWNDWKEIIHAGNIGTQSVNYATSAGSATKATQDGDGNVISSTYLPLAGGTLTNADNVFFTAGSTTKIAANSVSILQSPIPKYLWHDLFGFNRYGTPTYYVTADGSTWTEATLDKSHFAELENIGENVIKAEGQCGARWVWGNSSFAYSGGSWLAIGVGYASPSATVTITFESSTDNSAWTLRHQSTHSGNSAPIWCKIDGYGNSKYLRLTITKDPSDTTRYLNVGSIRLLTARWGSQGGGVEFEYPYYWDADRTISTLHLRPTSNNAYDLGTTSLKWANVYATALYGVLNGKSRLYTTRQTSANLTADGVVGVSHFVASSAMTTGKPPTGDSHIIHMSWDSSNGWDAQLAISASSSAKIAVRGQNNGTWGDWYPVGRFTQTAPTSGQVVITDGTDGSVKSSGYTIAKSVPSDALFTDHTYNFSGTTFYSGNQNNSEHNANNIQYNGLYYYTSNGPATSIGASTADGALYAQAYSTSWVGQIAQDYRDGSLFVRGKNDGTWQKWLAMLDSGNIGYNMTSTVNYDPHNRRFITSKSTSAWDAQAYSQYGYADAVYVTFKPNQTNMAMMIGLDSNPSEDANHNKIDYALYCMNNGKVSVYESGSEKSVGSPAYVAGDEFKVEYVGGYVRYYHNGTLLREVARSISGKLYMDSSFHGASSCIYDVEFGCTATNANYAASAEKATKDSDGNAINSTYLKKSGGTMTGQILTSFKYAVAMGSRVSDATTIPDLCDDLRYSSGCCGSVSIGTAYTLNNITIAKGWYNYLWVPHRSGGNSGAASGDNCNYGSLYLSGMTLSGCYMIRYASAAIAELRNLYTDNNTTYTFAESSSNGYFTVTPSGGSAQSVKIHGLGTSAFKNTTDTYSGTGTDPVTGKAVKQAIDALPEPMVFKGSLGTDGTITALPVDGSASVGDTYKVITTGTYAGKTAKVGDTFICLTKATSANTWELIPSGDEPSGTVTSVAVANGGGLSVSGSPITSSGTITISHSDTSSQASVSNSGRTYIQSVTLDTYGHVTKLTSATETVTDTNYYHTTGSWSGLTYTATANGGAGALAFTIPTGTSATTVAVGNHNHNGTYVKVAGDSMTGTLCMNSANENYAEGIRINAGANGYSTLTIGTAANSTSGISDCAFWIGTNSTKTSYQRKLYVAHNASTESTTYFYASSSTDKSPSLQVGGTIVGRGVVCTNAANSGTAGGLSLYGTDPTQYGVLFRTTANQGGHGYVTSDWATYFTMSNTNNRGWVFRRQSSGNVASIDTNGQMVLNGSLTLGGNTTNTSGVRQVYNATTQSLDFIFV